MSLQPDGPLVSVNELYPPKSERYMLVYDLDDLGVDFAMTSLYYRMAMSTAFDGAYLRHKLGGIKPWTVASNGDVTVSPAGNYLMRLVCNVVQSMLDIAPAGELIPNAPPIVKEITESLKSFGDYEILVGAISDMAVAVYRLLPPAVTWITLTTVYQHLAYVYAGQAPVEDSCLTMFR
jgi:hypothetical protein